MTPRKSPYDFAGSQAAYFHNRNGRYLCEVVEHSSFAVGWTWVRYLDENGGAALWLVPVADLVPVGDIARALLKAGR